MVELSRRCGRVIRVKIEVMEVEEGSSFLLG
jgi:hypothetical protein